MKILHMIGSVDPATGGPIEGIRRQNEITRDRVVREIATLDAPDAPFLANFPMTVHALGESRGGKGPRLGRYGYTSRLVPWLKTHAADYDVIVVNGLWNYIAMAASRVLPGGPTPYFVFTHGMMDPWFRKAYPLKHLVKQLFWLVGEGRLMAGARSVLFTSEEERRQARGVFLGHKYRETVVGYGSADPPAHDDKQIEAFHAAAPAVGGRRFVLFLSRIHEKKGCDLLVEAFARVAADDPDLDLVVAGPDKNGWRPQLEAMAEKLGVARRIHWPGGLFGDAKWGAMRAAEAFILPSHQENFGIAVAEALACGVPALISDKVNIWREVADNGAGLVEPDDLAGTEKLLRRWLTLDPDQQVAMRRAARELFQQRFNVHVTAPAVVATMRELI